MNKFIKTNKTVDVSIDNQQCYLKRSIVYAEKFYNDDNSLAKKTYHVVTERFIYDENNEIVVIDKKDKTTYPVYTFQEMEDMFSLISENVSFNGNPIEFENECEVQYLLLDTQNLGIYGTVAEDWVIG
jgi:hypothetical protein